MLGVYDWTLTVCSMEDPAASIRAAMFRNTYSDWIAMALRWYGSPSGSRASGATPVRKSDASCPERKTSGPAFTPWAMGPPGDGSFSQRTISLRNICLEPAGRKARPFVWPSFAVPPGGGLRRAEWLQDRRLI
jgi:hypothetical protein